MEQAPHSVPASRTGVSGQELMPRKLHLNLRQNSCAGTKHWIILFQSPSLEIFQNLQDTILCSLLWDDPAGAEGLDQMTHCDPFQPDPFWDSVKGLI